MKNTLETRLGMFVAVVMASAFLIIETLGGWGDLFGSGRHLRAQFDTVQDLKVGDGVKMAGVPIGHVEKIALAPAGGKVEVRMKLNKDVPVHTDSKGAIKFTGLMGQYYVDISFGTVSSPLMDEDQLLATTEQPDLSALMAKLDDVATGVQNLTKSFSGDKIDNILGPFTQFMRDNNPRISAILANLQAVSTEVSQGKGTVGKLVYDEALYNSAYASLSNLQETAAEVKATVAQARTMVDQINAGQGTVGKLVKDDTLYVETTAAMKNIREITGKVNQGQGSIGKIVNDQEFYNNAKVTLQKLDKATESLEDTGPLSLFGTLVSTLL
jgi:phospholipid/cholesterol/gamma-HCH transport system substrate-binding protein